MSRFMVTIVALMAVGALAVVADLTRSQPTERGAGQSEERRGDRGDRGDRGFDRESWRQRIAERMKESLGVSDEEWQVIQPRIEKVTTLQMQSRFGGFGGLGGFAGRRGGPGADAERPQTPMTRAGDELRSALEAEGTPSDTIKARLEAFRQARAKARADLAAAQNELREVLTLKQEAQLVMMGVLE